MAPIENPINLIIIIIGAFLGLSLGLFLLFSKSSKNISNLFLGIILLILSPYFVTGFLYRFELLDDFPHLIGIAAVFPFLIGPLVYFYIRACIQQNFKLRIKDAFHLIPFGIDLLLNLPLLLKSGAEKFVRYETLLAEGDLHQNGWIMVIKSIHGLIYFFFSSRIILQYRQHLTNTSSSIDNAFHRWTLLFIGIYTLPVSAMLAYVYFDYQRIFMLIYLLCFFSLILAVYIAIICKPELFHTFPHQMLIPESTEKQKQKYESSKLQDTQKDKYVEKLKTYVTTQKPFLESDLTLSQLSEQVNIPAHYVSQVVNEKLNCNFLDFINGYRVEEAKAKLVDPKLSHYTIMGVAHDAGFNSKSTFYTAFKKHTGMTPSQYRKQAKVLA